jgi:Family of unknown function (DUF6152)
MESGNKRKMCSMRAKSVAQGKAAAVLLCAGLLLAAAPSVWAHHAFTAEFDANKPVKLEGKVTKVEWINPHSWIHIDVTGPDGKVTKWMIEGGSPNALIRRGLTKDLLAVGTVIKVDGYQAKSGANRANGRNITFADGRKLFVGSSGDTGAPGDKP